MALWIFLHLLGMCGWLGGLVASFVLGPGSGAAEGAVVAAARLRARLQASVVGPSALLTILSGLVLTMRTTTFTGAVNAPVSGLYLMQGAGIAAGLVVLFVSVPTAARLGRLDAQKYAPLFAQLRGRQQLAAYLGGGLALLALVGGALLRG